MSATRRKTALLIGLLLVAGFLWLVWWAIHPGEPAYQGKRLSVWLDELVKLDYSRRTDPTAPPVAAVRAMGTNTIPWLFEEFQVKGTSWRHQLNLILAEQSALKFRLLAADDRLRRGTLGFQSLGELGAPAIPHLSDRLPGRARPFSRQR